MRTNADHAAVLARSSPRSARIVVPLLVDLIGPRSVLDVGCGFGAWLDVFDDVGVSDWFGVDTLEAPLPAERFRRADLTRGFEVDHRFDLVTCLEVAEHLPAGAAEPLVRSLAAAGDVIVFSAGIPGQGGIEHRNEQWPEYWAALFAQQGLQQFDVLREPLWSESDVSWWYRQNMYLYTTDQWAASHVLPEPWHPPPHAINPDVFAAMSARARIEDRPVREILEGLRIATARSLRKKADRVIRRHH